MIAAARVVPAEVLGAALPPVALYLHVPFCVARCPYCDFVVLPGAAARGPRNRRGAFVDALAVELGLRADGLDRSFPTRAPLETVYLGGGTPSLLEPEGVARLLDLIRGRFGVDPGAEITLEANPGPDERGDARTWRDLGFTRISFGAQSLDPVELRRLGRRHSPDDIAAGVADARAAGIESINLDLLYDVPGQTLDGWARTVAGALALGPDHVSAYALTLDDPDVEGLTGTGGDHLPVADGARRWRERARADQDDDRAAEQYGLASHGLAAAGFDGYELSNWARPGHESRHNLVYWQRRPYEAAGPGAHAFDGAGRRWNAAAFEPWLAALGDGRLPPGGSEAIDADGALAERLILGLRLQSGVAEDAVDDARRPAIDWGIAVGLLERAAGRLRLTMRGRLLGNELFSRLL